MRPFFKIILLINLLYVALFWGYDYWSAHQDNAFSDGISYLQAGQFFFETPKQVSATRPWMNGVYFGLPTFFKMGVAGQRTFIFLMQYGCWFGTLCLTAWFLKQIRLNYAPWILLWSSLNMSHLIETAYIASEPPAILLVLLSFVSWYLGHRAEKPFHWLNLSLLSLTLATLMRSQTQYLLILLTLYGLWRSSQLGKKHFAKQLVCFSSIWLLIGWQIAQMNKQHHIKTISVIGDYDFYIYLANYATVSHLQNKPLRDSLVYQQGANRWQEVWELEKKSNAGVAATYARTQFLDYFKKHPFRILLSGCRNIASNSFAGCELMAVSDTGFSRFLKYWTRFYNITLTFGMLLGLPLLYFWKRKYLKINALWFGSWVFCSYCVFTTGIAFGAGDRLHLIFFPIAVLGISSFIQDFVQNKVLFHTEK